MIRKMNKEDEYKDKKKKNKYIHDTTWFSYIFNNHGRLNHSGHGIRNRIMNRVTKMYITRLIRIAIRKEKEKCLE